MRYRYDAWGKCTIVSDTSTDGIAAVNPYRYRTYYFDSETGLYYLQSRYYDPETGRFINADDANYVTSAESLPHRNLFNYCNNMPVNMADNSGFWPEWVTNIAHKIRDGVYDLVNKTLVNNLTGFTWVNGIAHTLPYCWQTLAGYNEFYNMVANLFTDIADEYVDFSCFGRKYRIWLWKGDYLNLGAGAEVGIYTGGGPHWHCGIFNQMFMKLNLFMGSKTIFRWAQRTWWITGFNPQFRDVRSRNLTSSGTITFENKNMYFAFQRCRKSRNVAWKYNDYTCKADFVW